MSFAVEQVDLPGPSQGEAGAPVQARPMDQRVQRVIALMEENYRRGLSLNKLAQSVNLSIWHLGHLFKTETGLPPAQYLKAVRLWRARQLLATTSLSIKEVMSKVGLRDQSHFAKDFKRKFGLTPSGYRDSVAPAGRDPAAQEKESYIAGPHIDSERTRAESQAASRL
jgi:transcriptional regulator GlxA family with amidase domain